VYNDAYRTKRFSRVTIGSEQDKYIFNYALRLPGSNPYELFEKAKGMEFSTFDQDNDEESHNCADMYHGGWWYNDCHLDCMNGRFAQAEDCTMGEGIHWTAYLETLHKCLKKTLLMIKPVEV